MTKKIDKHGVHLHGCECKECMKTNAICLQCSREYWADPKFPELNECPRCMWTPELPELPTPEQCRELRGKSV